MKSEWLDGMVNAGEAPMYYYGCPHNQSINQSMSDADWACENQPCEYKLHWIMLSLIS